MEAFVTDSLKCIGGISYFSGRYGFASDNVAMFEVR